MKNTDRKKYLINKGVMELMLKLKELEALESLYHEIFFAVNLKGFKKC